MDFNRFYINKIINHIVDDEVHRHLVKYSRGVFPGPDLLIKIKDERITVAGDYEYTNFIEFLFISEINSNMFNVKGKIYALKDITESLKDLEISSMKKTPHLYSADISGSFNRDILLKLFDNESIVALLFNIHLGKDFYSNIKTGARIPKPKIERDETPPSFITMRLDENELKDKFTILLKGLIPDLPSEDRRYEMLKVENDFAVTELVFPENTESISSSQLRYMVKRKGYLTRRIIADTTTIEKIYYF
ncbi:MAG: hypothetical protein OdinLCB4_000200 [Candidatus Odinarchaeum yellowstonii]|uniref:Uncharacterized protein n=1 Tax=Odinarchaeota yellowstonii (strain LCB_4) TaxID=1841599 RepID=A0AAF0IBH3_ODILC|nr:MAG: hypothetical protein OdinLCB4_000200 [Candidatus Odinarchaeum yellowstonii]